MVVLEFYVNLTAHVVKKVRVPGVLVDFGVGAINDFYQLEPVDDDDYNRVQEAPNYLEVLQLLTNGRSSIVKCMMYTSRPSIWPTFPKFGTTLSLPDSFRLPTSVK